MKKITFCLFAFLITTQLQAQAPQKMSYQAVIRNTSGQLISNSTVGVQISVLQGSASGIAVYIERHTSPTNANGLTSLEIGNGTVIAGSFAAIDWANGPYYLKTETDPNGGTTYSIEGTNQLLSVPYALYAATAGNSGSGSGGTLDQAYDQGGAGAGRTISSDAGAVQINNSGSNTIGLEVNSAVNNSTAILTNVSGTGVGFRAESTSPTNTNYQTPYQFNISTTLSTEDNNFASFAYYPNPVKDVLYLDNLTLSKASIYSVLGQLIDTKTFENATSNTLDLSSLESGIYLIVLENDSQQKTIKVVKE